MPVIILTAYGTLDTATQAIRYHVQDYLLKPISPAQILESVRRVVSEVQGNANSPSPQAATSSAADRISTLPGGATLAWDTRVLSWPGGRISLTPTEGHLLKILFDHRNAMVSHPALVFQIQGYHVDNEEAAKILRPVVSRLRRKLAVVPNWNNRIKTVRGDGYVLEWMSQPVR
jgi:DNA-binding response OmpR family regulator